MFSKIILSAICAFGLSIALCSCDLTGSAAQKSTVSKTYDEGNGENIIVTFKDMRINADDYIALISIFEEISYEQINISDEADFADFVGVKNAYLYDLYSFITSLDASEGAALYHDIMYMPEML